MGVLHSFVWNYIKYTNLEGFHRNSHNYIISWDVLTIFAYWPIYRYREASYTAYRSVLKYHSTAVCCNEYYGSPNSCRSMYVHTYVIKGLHKYVYIYVCSYVCMCATCTHMHTTDVCTETIILEPGAHQLQCVPSLKPI